LSGGNWKFENVNYIKFTQPQSKLTMANPSGIGGFRPGQSGNPGGKRKGLALLQFEAQKHMRAMLNVLIKNAKKGSTAAAIAVLDRGFGKPAQNIDMKLLLDKRLSDLSNAELLALEERLAAMDAEDGPH
jgi:hypothetical protein